MNAVKKEKNEKKYPKWVCQAPGERGKLETRLYDDIVQRRSNTIFSSFTVTKSDFMRELKQVEKELAGSY